MNIRTIPSLIAALALAGSLGTTGCSKKKKASPETTEPSAAASVVEARNIFKTRCVGCHGASGDGKGVNAASLSKPPQDYTDPAWQAKVTDEELKKAIIFGGKAVGKSELMLPNPDLENPAKAAVVDELVKMIRGFAPAGAAPPADTPPPATKDPAGEQPLAPETPEGAPPKPADGPGQGT